MDWTPETNRVPTCLLTAGLGLKRIVEEIDGAMKHGTWRDEHGMRLKDTPEWVEFYNAITEADAAAMAMVGLKAEGVL